MENIFKPSRNRRHLPVLTIERVLSDAERAFKNISPYVFIFPPIVSAVPEPVVLSAHGIDFRKFSDSYVHFHIDWELAKRMLIILSVHARCELDFYRTGAIREDLCKKYGISASVEKDICQRYEKEIDILYNSLKVLMNNVASKREEIIAIQKQS